MPPHADAKEDFSPNFGDDTPNTEFGLTRCAIRLMAWFLFWFVNLLPVCQQNQEHSPLGFHMPRVLLTGFGPFGSHEINPTESIVNAFPSILPIKNPFGPGSSEVSLKNEFSLSTNKGRHGLQRNWNYVNGTQFFTSVCVENAKASP